MSRKNVYIVASETENNKQSNIIIHCMAPCKMTMHEIYKNLKKAATDFCNSEDGYGKDVLARNNYKFTWREFAEYVKNTHTMPYDIEIMNVITSAPSIDINEEIVNIDNVFTEGLP